MIQSFPYMSAIKKVAMRSVSKLVGTNCNMTTGNPKCGCLL